MGGFYAFDLRYLAETGAGGPTLWWAGPVGGRQVVPSTSFYTFEVPNFGLIGYYYANAHWQGTPLVVQRDIFLTAGEVLPAPYSIIWRDKLLAEQPGQYTLGTKSDDGSLLHLDGRLVVDNGGAHGAQYVEAQTNLTAGYHDIELRYFQEGGSREFELWWIRPDGRKELIPPTSLLPWEGEAPAWQPSQPEAAEAPLPGVLADKVWQIWPAEGEGGEQEAMSPRGVAVSPLNGWLYVSDASSRRVRVFDADGNKLFIFGEEAELEEPGDLVVDSRGNVWLLDPLADSVLGFSSEGRLLARLRDGLWLFHPRGIGIDRQDRLYVADTGGSRVVVLSTAGEVLAAWGEAGQGPGQLDQPTDVAVGPDGQVYVADAFNLRVQHLDADGAYLGEWPIMAANTYDSPHLAVSPTHVIYLTSPEEHQVLAYDPAGRFLGQVGAKGEGLGQFVKPMAVDASGRLYVADPLLGRVQGFSSSSSPE